MPVPTRERISGKRPAQPVAVDSSVNERGNLRRLPFAQGDAMKICVLVKEVPDAAVTKRINPSSGRLDRSGEKNLNPYDTHAIEAAMQVREGGAVEVDEIVAVTMGPDSAGCAPPKGVSLGGGRLSHLYHGAPGGVGPGRDRAGPLPAGCKKKPR